MEISNSKFKNKFRLLISSEPGTLKTSGIPQKYANSSSKVSPEDSRNTVPGMFKHVENYLEIHRCRKVCQVHGRLLFSNYHSINELAESPQPCTLAVQKVKNEQVESLGVQNRKNVGKTPGSIKPRTKKRENIPGAHKQKLAGTEEELLSTSAKRDRGEKVKRNENV